MKKTSDKFLKNTNTAVNAVNAEDPPATRQSLGADPDAEARWPNSLLPEEIVVDSIQLADVGDTTVPDNTLVLRDGILNVADRPVGFTDNVASATIRADATVLETRGMSFEIGRFALESSANKNLRILVEIDVQQLNSPDAYDGLIEVGFMSVGTYDGGATPGLENYNSWRCVQVKELEPTQGMKATCFASVTYGADSAISGVSAQIVRAVNTDGTAPTFTTGNWGGIPNATPWFVQGMAPGQKLAIGVRLTQCSAGKQTPTVFVRASYAPVTLDEYNNPDAP